MPYLVGFLAAASVAPFSGGYGAVPGWPCRRHEAVALLRGVRASELLVVAEALGGRFRRAVRRAIPGC